jgi:hypothetical protein
LAAVDKLLIPLAAGRRAVSLYWLGIDTDVQYPVDGISHFDLLGDYSDLEEAGERVVIVANRVPVNGQGGVAGANFPGKQRDPIIQPCAQDFAGRLQKYCCWNRFNFYKSWQVGNE